MRAMLLTQPGPIETSPLRSEHVPDPIPLPGQIRIRVRCCAVCRTDLHLVEADIPTAKLPVIPGHQIVGEVDQAGPGASRFKLGARVGIAWLAQTDGTCRWCAAGRENLCPGSIYTGYHIDGGYAPFAVVHEDFAYEIPAAFDDVSASPLLCAGIIGYRAFKRTYLPANGSLAIFGFGSSAHILTQIAVHRKHDVFVVSRSQRHQAFARSLGAAWAGSEASQMPRKVDAAVVFAPAGHVVLRALECLAPGGAVALAGIHMTPIPELDYPKHLFGERDVHPVTANTRDDGRELLREAAAAGVKPHTLNYDLPDANRALQDLKAGNIDGTGVLLIR
jgi:propanol-preferring alcohol dehydrogenase